MATELDGCCSRLYRFILVVLNVIIFILGLLTLVFAAVMRWTNVFSELTKLTELIDVGKIGSVSILFMIIGGFALLLSLLGLFGLCCLSKFLLIVYEIIVVLLFAAHGIGLLVLVFGHTSIEDAFKKEMGHLVDRLNGNYTAKPADCDSMKTLSVIFTCCGDKLPSDLTNITVRTTCCDYSQPSKPPVVGCTLKAIDRIKSNANSYLIIPSGVILAVELLVIIITPLMICDIKRSRADDPVSSYRPRY